MYLIKHLISTICSSHTNDHRTSSIDCDLHKLTNIILCELRNLKDLLSLSPIINDILCNVLTIIAYHLTFYVAFYARQLYRQVLLQARISYGNSVRSSVRPSVCHDPVPIQGQVR